MFVFQRVVNGSCLANKHHWERRSLVWDAPGTITSVISITTPMFSMIGSMELHSPGINDTKRKAAPTNFEGNSQVSTIAFNK